MMNPVILFLLKIAFLLLLNGCAFNRAFFQPATISGTPSPAFSFTEDTVTTYVKIDTASLQPLLMRVGEDTLNFPFDIESTRFESLNGNMLHGWMLRPKHVEPKYTILHFHGSGQFIFTQYRYMAPLVEQGFQVFVFDYSGYGFSEGKASRANVLDDGRAALDYLTTKEEVKATKLVLYGQSLGGYLAALIGTEKQDDIDALVIEGAYTSHKQIASHRSPIFGRILPIQSGYPASKAIRDYHKPLLVIHSIDDTVVPFKMGQKIFSEANEPKELYQVDKAHIAATQFYAKEIADRIRGMVKD